RFRFAFWPEKPVCRAHTDFIRGELLGVAKREICRNDYRFYAAPPQEMREHFFIRRRVFGLSLHLALELTKHDKFICIGLLASSIDLEIAQDQRAFAVSLQENKWIRRPKLRGIKHVRVGLACGDDKAGGFAFCFAHGGLYLSSDSSLGQRVNYHPALAG